MARDVSLTTSLYDGSETSTRCAEARVPHGRKSGDELLTVHDAARLLCVSVSWVYEHTRKNCIDPLPVVKLGKYLRFDGADLRSYIDSKRAAATGARRQR